MNSTVAYFRLSDKFRGEPMNERQIIEGMEELLTVEPELTFRDVCAELIKKKVLEYDLLQDSYVQAWVYERYAKTRARAMVGRINTTMS